LDWKITGAEINFKIQEINKTIKIFTTRPDTIYGASFIAISINHKIALDLIGSSEVEKIKEQFDEIRK
jgi:leucyl-tRNA synthetase